VQSAAPAESISDANLTARRLFWQQYKWKSALALLIGSALSVLAWLAVKDSGDPDDYEIVLYPAIIAISIVGGWYAKIHAKVHWRMMEQFAKARGYTWGKSAPTRERAGMIFGLGHSRLFSNYLVKESGGITTELYNYTYRTGSGKNKRNYNFTVIEITGASELPRMIVDAKHNGQGIVDRKQWFGSNASLKDLVNLGLEGNFNQHFTVRIKKGQQIPALQLLAPDVMIQLLDYEDKFDMETIGRKVFIYDNQHLSKIKDLDQLHNVSAIITREWQRYLRQKPKLLTA
jgi:hypothetical protein